MAGAVDTLFLPHSTGIFAPLGEPWLYLNAEGPAGGFKQDMKSHLLCGQGWRDKYINLEAAGMNVVPGIKDQSDFSGAFVLLTKHKRENQAMIAQANHLLKEGAPILVAGAKNLGVASIKKWVGQRTAIIESLAKNHATVFWFAADQSLEFNVDSTSELAGFQTGAGMFSAEKIDKGSALLATHLCADITGDVADFGAGWGYLSTQILAKSAPNSLALFEAHWPSLEAAKKNLSPIAKIKCAYHWHDVTSEPIIPKFDWVVMNPPFHAGHKTEPQIGARFIESAANALKKGGRLLMVANTNLPYEQVLKDHFSKHECLEIRDGFKVLRAFR